MLLAACSVTACGSVASDGGQSGTGISAIRGNVVAVTGGAPEVDNIRVSLTGTDLATRTDTAGRFELRGEARGPGELLFERERDGLFARTDVVIPAGGVLELEQIVLDVPSGEARPSRRRVEFEGFVEALDCASGSFRVTPKEEEDGTVFVVDAMSATIRDDDRLLTCSDLRVGDRLQVRGESSDGSTLVNAQIKLEDREDSPGNNRDDDEDDDAADNHEGDDGSEEHESDDPGDDQSEDHESDDPADDHEDDEPSGGEDDHPAEDHSDDDAEEEARSPGPGVHH
jgi:hypothetical protein